MKVRMKLITGNLKFLLKCWGSSTKFLDFLEVNMMNSKFSVHEILIFWLIRSSTTCPSTWGLKCLSQDLLKQSIYVVRTLNNILPINVMTGKLCI